MLGAVVVPRSTACTQTSTSTEGAQVGHVRVHCHAGQGGEGRDGREGRGRLEAPASPLGTEPCNVARGICWCSAAWFGLQKGLACEITSINLQRIPSPFFVMLAGSGEDLGGLRSMWGCRRMAAETMGGQQDSYPHQLTSHNRARCDLEQEGTNFT